MTAAEELLPLCACDCGERVKHPNHKFLHAHNARVQNLSKHLKKEKLPGNPCACGCGQITRHHKTRYIMGHYKPRRGASQAAKDRALARLEDEVLTSSCGKCGWALHGTALEVFAAFRQHACLAVATAV